MPANISYQLASVSMLLTHTTEWTALERYRDEALSWVCQKKTFVMTGAEFFYRLDALCVAQPEH